MIRLPKLYSIGVLALALLLMMSAPVLADTARGTVLGMSMEDQEITIVTDQGEVLTLHYPSDVSVFVNSEERTYWDLEIGDEVTINFNRQEEDLVVTAIRCARD
jgi:Cu/Ag efflux protein CusF